MGNGGDAENHEKHKHRNWQRMENTTPPISRKRTRQVYKGLVGQWSGRRCHQQYWTHSVASCGQQRAYRRRNDASNTRCQRRSRRRFWLDSTSSCGQQRQGGYCAIVDKGRRRYQCQGKRQGFSAVTALKSGRFAVAFDRWKIFYGVKICKICYASLSLSDNITCNTGGGQLINSSRPGLLHPFLSALP